ncbi:PAS domain S-box protein [Saccharospirillum alexandrii]|uniref:PAS domain S-box protein n=1 Tax=Saccharospirillum alexandrii TaxID=2448477 RepID=UPI000FD98094|nr:PAS domain S-box protein [Saccharospirillum alexandrii]
MQEPPIPDNERQRLRALGNLDILDTPAEVEFDRITRLARNALGVQTVLISLVDANRQWFKSRQGLEATETPRSISFCGHAILGKALFEIPDALLDNRFADNPLVAGEPKIRFYAGMPLRARDGSALGTLCLIDSSPRTLTDNERTVLADLAELAEVELQRRENPDRVYLRALTEGTQAGLWEWNVQTGATVFNERWADIVGYRLAELEPVSINTWQSLAHPEDLASSEALLNAHFNGETPVYELVCRMKHKLGHWVWVLDRGKVVSWMDDGRPEWVMGTHLDISDLKESEFKRLQSNQALQSRERLLRTIIDNIPMNIYVKDRSGRKILANRAELDHLGLASEADILGKHDRDLYAGYLAERADEQERPVLEQGETISLLESEGADQDGRPLWYRVSKIPLRDSTGDITGLVGLSIDVTDETHSKQSLRGQLQFLKVLNDLATDDSIHLNERLNRALALGSEHLGLELGIISQIDHDEYKVRFCHAPEGVALAPGDVFALGDTFCSLILERSDELIIQAVAGSTYQQHPCYDLFGVETYVGIRLTVNGQVYGTLNFSSSAPLEKSIDESNLAFVRLLGRWIESVLGRDQDQRLLQQREARLRVLFELSPLGIALTDLSSGRFIAVNDALVEQSGYDRDTLLSMTKRELSPGLSHQIDKEGIRESAEKDQIGPVEVQVKHRGGHQYPANVIGLKVSDADGSRLLWTVYEDISDRRRIERLKSELVSTVSHELRTPLTSISGSLKLLAAGHLGEVPAAASKMVSVALKNTDRLILLVNDLLDMDKLITGRMPFDMKPHALQPLLATTADNIAGYAHLHRVAVVVGEVPPVSVKVDAHRFEQIMANLLSNAIKFSPEGGSVTIDARTTTSTVTITVRDHGPGIPEAFRSQIFQRFSQADNRDNRQKGGTGLGLAISHSIVQTMGGDIGFESRPGLTEFRVVLVRV